MQLGIWRRAVDHSMCISPSSLICRLPLTNPARHRGSLCIDWSIEITEARLPPSVICLRAWYKLLPRWSILNDTMLTSYSERQFLNLEISWEAWMWTARRAMVQSLSLRKLYRFGLPGSRGNTWTTTGHRPPGYWNICEASYCLLCWLWILAFGACQSIAIDRWTSR